MTNCFSNVSRSNKPITSLKSYTKAYAAITPMHAPWLPESSVPATSGRPWRSIATLFSKNVYPARNMVTSSIQNKNNFILYYLRGPSQSGEWIFSTLFPKERPSKIPYSSHRLLHQVDKGQTISHHYSPTGATIHLERYYMSIWRPTYDQHRQWPIIHRQRPR